MNGLSANSFTRSPGESALEGDADAIVEEGDPATVDGEEDAMVEEGDPATVEGEADEGDNERSIV